MLKGFENTNPNQKSKLGKITGYKFKLEKNHKIVL